MKLMKYLSGNSRTMRSAMGVKVKRWAALLAMTAPCVAVVIGTLAEWETDTEMKLATVLTCLIAMLCIVPMVWQFGTTNKEV